MLDSGDGVELRGGVVGQAEGGLDETTDRQRKVHVGDCAVEISCYWY